MKYIRSVKITVLAVVLCLALAAGLVTAANAQAPDILEELKLFSRAMQAILEGYVEDVKPREMFYAAVRGMLASLDKYSVFIDPKQYELLKINMQGEYAGIGTWIRETEGFVVIDRIKPGTPAAKADIAVGDRLLAVDGVLVAGMNIGDVGRMLRGEPETTVHLKLFRVPEAREFEVELLREKIEIEAVKDVRIAGRAVGYVHLVDWSEQTVRQFDEAMTSLADQGMEALIIDLRGNSGGLMKQAIALAGRFLPEGMPVISVRSKIEVQRKDHVVEKQGQPFYDYPVLILVNHESASASEIFSAALQDAGRATVLGTQTFGKASVQSVVPLDDVSAMRLTTARYHSPKGRVIDETGITPNVIVEDGTAKDPAAQQQIRTALKIFQDYFQ